MFSNNIQKSVAVKEMGVELIRDSFPYTIVTSIICAGDVVLRVTLNLELLMPICERKPLRVNKYVTTIPTNTYSALPIVCQ